MRTSERRHPAAQALQGGAGAACYPSPANISKPALAGFPERAFFYRLKPRHLPRHCLPVPFSLSAVSHARRPRVLAPDYPDRCYDGQGRRLGGRTCRGGGLQPRSGISPPAVAGRQAAIRSQNSAHRGQCGGYHRPHCLSAGNWRDYLTGGPFLFWHIPRLFTVRLTSPILDTSSICR